MTDEQKKHERNFKRVANKKDWKAPIDAIIRVDDFEAINDAVEFFTATTLRVDENMGHGKVRVKAKGYRMGPAGDH